MNHFYWDMIKYTEWKKNEFVVGIFKLDKGHERRMLERPTYMTVLMRWGQTKPAHNEL